jgi:hypothetical protein
MKIKVSSFLKWLIIAYAFLVPFELLLELLFGIRTQLKPYRLFAIILIGSVLFHKVSKGKLASRFENINILLLVTFLLPIFLVPLQAAFSSDFSLKW